MAVPVICYGCGETATVTKVSANIRHSCGSDDVGLYEDTPAQRAIVRRANSAGVDFATFMGAKTEHQEFPATVDNWSEYQGPMPGPNEMSNGTGEITCPTCHGDGFDVQEGNACRECGGSGKVTPTTTARPPEVARHNYPSTQTKVPFMGSRPTLDLDARCPNCQSKTKLAATKNQLLQAVWRCRGGCGALANLDYHPTINPYDQATHRHARTATKRTRLEVGAGRVWPMLASVHEANPGLSKAQVLSLVLATVARYPEEG